MGQWISYVGKFCKHLRCDYISANNPNLAKALLTLHDKYKNLRDDMQNRLETIDVDSLSNEKKKTRLPVEIVSDFIQENNNYFDILEKIWKN